MPGSNALSPGDPSSFSRPDQCAITDISLDVKIDFGRKVVHGTATYKCKKVLAGADSLVRSYNSQLSCILYSSLEIHAIILVISLILFFSIHIVILALTIFKI